MFNTIILLEGTANLTDEELKKFEEGDTIYGNNSNPVEITRWNISKEKQARDALADRRCSYNDGRIKEYALEFCETDEDGEFVSGSDFDFALKESMLTKEEMKLLYGASSKEDDLRSQTVGVTVYADTVYPDWWDEPDKYGDDNTAAINVDESDLVEWLKQTDWLDEDGEGFMHVYTHDDTNDLYGWLKENGRYVEVGRY